MHVCTYRCCQTQTGESSQVAGIHIHTCIHTHSITHAKNDQTSQRTGLTHTCMHACMLNKRTLYRLHTGQYRRVSGMSECAGWTPTCIHAYMHTCIHTVSPAHTAMRRIGMSQHAGFGTMHAYIHSYTQTHTLGHLYTGQSGVLGRAHMQTSGPDQKQAKRAMRPNEASLCRNYGRRRAQNAYSRGSVHVSS